MNLLLLGFLTGLDNFLVSAGLGTQRLRRAQLLALVAGFALCEALMPVLGFYLIGGLPGLDWAGPVLLVMAGGLVGWRVLAGVSGFDPRFAVVLVPLVLSLDNLAAGAGLGAVGGFDISAAALAGGVAATVSLLGLGFGRMAVQSLRFDPRIATAVALVAVGLLDMSGTL